MMLEIKGLNRAKFTGTEVNSAHFAQISFFFLYKLANRVKTGFNPLRPNSDLSQTSHCNIMGLSVSEVMRIENMITQVKFF